ncbi:hypothetical protein KAH27_03430 [bacterium]|nr:hypothetical protein [bacterium]
MIALLKPILAICIIVSVVIATTNDYTCNTLSMNDNGSWNVERPNVSDDDVTDLKISANCGPDIEVKSDEPSKATFSNINGEMTVSFKKSGQPMSESVNFSDFDLSE